MGKVETKADQGVADAPSPAQEPTVATIPAGSASAPITVEQLLAVVQAMVSANTLSAEKVREIATQATIDAYDRTSGKNWDIAKFPARSVFNPLGEKDHPRPTIRGEVFWVGFKCSETECFKEEIELLNQLEPGIYHDGAWFVKDLQPGVRSRERRRILVLFPCAQDSRGNLPSMVDMLREMTQDAAALV